jgi:hypothetical protein
MLTKIINGNRYEECINILERELNIRKKGDFGKANLDTVTLNYSKLKA